MRNNKYNEMPINNLLKKFNKFSTIHKALLGIMIASTSLSVGNIFVRLVLGLPFLGTALTIINSSIFIGGLLAERIIDNKRLTAKRILRENGVDLSISKPNVIVYTNEFVPKTQRYSEFVFVDATEEQNPNEYTKSKTLNVKYGESERE